MMPAPGWVWIAAVLAGATVSGAVLFAVARPGGRWGARLRARLVLGLPLGTLLVVAFVLAVYLLVQHGLAHWHNPTQVPYRAWSYAYPLGIVVSPFAHAGPGHLTGNLVGAIGFGALAEYAWGHFPDERGTETFSSHRTNPYARAAGFALGALGVGLVTSLFSLGPVIGFSGVVFAFVGLALVRYPLATVLLVLATNGLRLLLDALRAPTTTAGAGSEFTTPWFAGIAIHGHYLGVLLGVVLGVVLVRRRGVRPSAVHLWFATVVFGIDQALWALYTPLGGNRFLLLRALGLAVLLAFAALVTVGARASPRPLVGAIDLSRREAATGLLVAVLLAVAVVAVPFNLLAVDDASAGAASTVRVGDYTVYYAEDVSHQLVPAVDVSTIDETPRVPASGVVVASERRGIWWPEITADELAARGHATVYLGGPGWRVPVRATRPGWQTLGGGTAYKVYLRAGDRPRTLSFASEPAAVDATVAGRNLSVAPTAQGFDVVVSRDGAPAGRAAVPANGSAVTIGGLRLVRDGRALIARADGTRVRVARRVGGS